MKNREIPFVIVRAYGNEPVQLTALAVSNGRVEVAGANRELSICLPLAFIYKFDPDVFSRLREAYNAGDTQRLTRMWCEAEHYTEHR